jgi:diguanylate cyclase (GGDEF)-like protein/PAS domain S-box-containing protein
MSPFSSLRVRLLTIVLIATLPALALILYTGVAGRRHAAAAVRDNTLVLARLAASYHERLLDLTRQSLADLAQLPEARDGRPAACNALLARLLREHHDFADLGVIEPSGQILCTGLPTTGPLERGDREYFRRVVATRSLAVGDVEPAGIPPRPALFVGYPVIDERNSLRAVAFGAIDLDWVQQFATAGHVPEGRALLLVDRKGEILSRFPDPDRWVGRVMAEAPIVRAILAQRSEGIAEVQDIDGVQRLYAFVPLRGGKAEATLYVAVGDLPALAYAQANAILMRNLLALGAVALLAFVVAWAAGDLFIVRRVKALLDAATKVTAGNLEARTGVAYEAGALGQLARQFDEMAAALQRREAEARTAAEELRHSEARKSAILEGALDAVVTVDEEGRITEFNPAAERTFGFARAQVIGQPIDVIIPHPLREQRPPRLGRYLGGGEALALGQRLERPALCADGTELPVEISVTPTFEGGRTIYTAFIRDITPRKEAEAALRAVRDELQQRVEERTAELQEANLKLVAWVEELQQRAQDLMRLSELGDVLRACQDLGEAYAAIGKHAPALFPRQSGSVCARGDTQPLLECVASWGERRYCEQVFPTEDCWALRRGRPHVVESSDARLVCRHVAIMPPGGYLCVPMMAQGEAVGLLFLTGGSPGRSAEGLRQPLSLARQQVAMTAAEQLSLALSNLRLQQSLRAQAIHDPLTGLFNRRYMEATLARELLRATRRGVPLGLVMLDIDHFKRFNDTFGHAAGDTLLKEVGALLRKGIRGEDIACRYGGEEFALVFMEASLPDVRDHAMEILEETRSLKVQHRGQALGTVTLSAGIAVFPDHGATVETLLEAADAALYQAKADGRDRLMVAQELRVRGWA